MFDPLFKPKGKTGAAKKLYDLQQIYAWAVLLQVFKNPLGITSLSPHALLKDARAAFLDHAELQKLSPSNTYSLNNTVERLFTIKVLDYKGTKLEFVVEFFEVLDKLNKTSINASTPIIGYPIANAMFLGALQEGELDLVRQ